MVPSPGRCRRVRRLTASSGNSWSRGSSMMLALSLKGAIIAVDAPGFDRPHDIDTKPEQSRR